MRSAPSLPRPSLRAALALLVLLPALALALEPVAPEALERAVQETFADPELAAGLETSHLGVTSGVGALLERAWRWVQQLAAHLLIESPLAYFGVVGLLLIVLALLVAHIAWSVRQAFSRGGEAHEAVEAARAEGRRRSAALRAEAHALAGQGDLREATRRLLLAFLALIDEQGALEVARGWTNREIVARLRLPAAIQEELRAFVSAADAACYGSRAPEAEAFAGLEALLGRVERVGAGVGA